MTPLEKTKEAIRRLDSARDKLGDDVVDVTIAALQEMQQSPALRPSSDPKTAVSSSLLSQLRHLFTSANNSDYQLVPLVNQLDRYTQDRPVFIEGLAKGLVQAGLIQTTANGYQLPDLSHKKVDKFVSHIARQYELISDIVRAVELYELAGNQARQRAALKTAINNYRQAITLLTNKPRHTPWLLRLQQEMSLLLLRCLRLIEATRTYMNIQYMAEIDGDLALQAEAWLGLAKIHREQSDYLSMLHAAQHAYDAARLVAAHFEECTALLLQSEAFCYLGRLASAKKQAQEAVHLSQQLSLWPQQARGLSLLYQIHMSQGEQATAAAQSEQLEQIINQAAERIGDVSVLAFCHFVLAGMYQSSCNWLLARSHLETAVSLYTKLNNQSALAQVYTAIGQMALQQGQIDQAIDTLRHAIALAHSIGNEKESSRSHLYLAQALIANNQQKEAQTILTNLLSKIDNTSLTDWWGHMIIYDLLVRLYLAQQQPQLALTVAQQALTVAQKRERQRDKAIAWRLLGQALQAAHSHTTTVTIRNQAYDVTSCFASSWQQIETANQKVPGYRQRATQTLQAWQAYEMKKRQADQIRALFGKQQDTLQTTPTWDALYMPPYS